MEEITLRYFEVIAIIIAAIGAVFFGWKQNQINERMKKLQDYVAISVISKGMGSSEITIMNVGKVNLYLRQCEIGFNTETFSKPLLIPAGTGQYSNLSVRILNLQPRMQTKFYLIDESGEKYISTGQIIVEQISIPSLPTTTLPSGGTTAPQPTSSITTVPNFLIWTFKTEKYNWQL